MENVLESARAIARFFLEQGFTEECLNRLGLAELPLNSLARRSATALAATGDPQLDLLIRLFCLGEPIEKGEGKNSFRNRSCAAYWRADFWHTTRSSFSRSAC